MKRQGDMGMRLAHAPPHLRCLHDLYLFRTLSSFLQFSTTSYFAYLFHCIFGLWPLEGRIAHENWPDFVHFRCPGIPARVSWNPRRFSCDLRDVPTIPVWNAGPAGPFGPWARRTLDQGPVGCTKVAQGSRGFRDSSPNKAQYT